MQYGACGFSLMVQNISVSIQQGYLSCPHLAAELRQKLFRKLCNTPNFDQTLFNSKNLNEKTFILLDGYEHFPHSVNVTIVTNTDFISHCKFHLTDFCIMISF
jgi:hypothetical protein